VLKSTRSFGRMRGSAAEVALGATDVWTFRDGKIVRYDAYADHAEALRAVGLEE
jgi:ketosteroid isomerase-like protein